MAAKQVPAERDFGEATVTSKGQVIVPSALRQALGIVAGDRLRFVQSSDGSIRVEARKRRRIVDIARANAFHAGEAGLDFDAAIEASIASAVRDRDRRSRNTDGGA
jgi:AbrB family looped-hinge helix DNA binding protein